MSESPQRVIVHEKFRYLRIRAAIARDQFGRDRWLTFNTPHEISFFWWQELQQHKQLLDERVVFSKFIEPTYMILTQDEAEIIEFPAWRVHFQNDPGDEDPHK